MKLCPNCRETVNDDAHVCETCGARQQALAYHMWYPGVSAPRGLWIMYVLTALLVVAAIAFNVSMVAP